MELSKTTNARIIIGIIGHLKEIENKDYIYIDTGYERSGIFEKISKRTGITTGEYRESGMVDIREFIDITFDSHQDRIIRKLQGRKLHYSHDHMPRHKFEFEVDEKLIEAVKQFEEKNIPSSGPCKTHIGELFRAIQYIQYRAMNDGDLCWEVDSPTFMSYIFLMSRIDKLNYSSASYNNETGQYEYEFTDEYLKTNSWDGKISTVIEDTMMETANFIKYQLMDLLLNGKIEDKPNKWDSRNFSRLEKKERYY